MKLLCPANFDKRLMLLFTFVAYQTAEDLNKNKGDIIT